MVNDALEHAHAHRTARGALDEPREEITRIGQRRTAERGEGTPRHREPGELLEEIHLADEDRDITFGMIVGQLLEQRTQLIEPAFP